MCPDVLHKHDDDAERNGIHGNGQDGIEVRTSLRHGWVRHQGCIPPESMIGGITKTSHRIERLTTDGEANFGYGDVDSYGDFTRVDRRRAGQPSTGESVG